MNRELQVHLILLFVRVSLFLLTSLNHITSVVVSDYNQVLAAQTLTLDEDRQAPSSRTDSDSQIYYLIIICKYPARRSPCRRSVPSFST